MKASCLEPPGKEKRPCRQVKQGDLESWGRENRVARLGTHHNLTFVAVFKRRWFEVHLQAEGRNQLEMFTARLCAANREKERQRLRDLYASLTEDKNDDTRRRGLQTAEHGQGSPKSRGSQTQLP